MSAYCTVGDVTVSGATEDVPPDSDLSDGVREVSLTTT